MRFRKDVLLHAQLAALGTKRIKNTFQNSKEPDLSSRKENSLCYPDVWRLTEPSSGSNYEIAEVNQNGSVWEL